MFKPDDLIAEFDPKTRIVHFTARKRLVFNTIESGNLLSRAVKDTLRKYLGDDPGYMITDYTKIIIEPDLLNLYAHEMKEIIDTYLFPGGIARYGMEITRITAKLGHTAYIGGKPNLFNTKKEAFEYIHSLINKNKTDSNNTETASRPSKNCRMRE